MSNISLLCGMLFKVIPRFSLIKSTLYFYFMSIQNFGFIYLLVTLTLWRSGPKLDGYFFTFTLTFSTILRITLYFYFIKVKKPQSKEKTKYKVKISKKSPTPAKSTKFSGMTTALKVLFPAGWKRPCNGGAGAVDIRPRLLDH